MKRNIFITSTLRQLARSAVLMLLIALATFLLVMYGAEYLSIKDKVEKISEYYPSIGYLMVEGGNGVSGNVIAGVQTVKDSRYVAATDERRGVQGVLQGMTNTNFYGIYPPKYEESFRLINGKIYSPHHTDAFFVGEVVSIDPGFERWSNVSPPYITRLEQPYIQLSVRADTILCGYPEHIVEGQTVKLRYYLSSDEVEEYMRLNERYGEADAVYPATPVDGITIGESYLFRGAYCYQTLFAHDASAGVKPEIGNDFDPLFLIPLNTETDGVDRTRDLVGESLWYAPTGTDGMFDTSTQGLEDFDAELARLRLCQSGVQLRTTADMTMLPNTQPEVRQISLFSGRMIDRDDNDCENRAVVTHHTFAEERGLGIGDTVTVRIPQSQFISAIAGLADSNVYIPNDLALAGIPQESYDYELELEIVGLYRYNNWSRPASPIGGFDDTYFYSIMYIPDSILHHDYTVELAPFRAASGAWLDDPYLPEAWFTFALDDTRNRQAFVDENEETLGALGLSVGFVQNNADIFWESAEPILRSAMLNALLFAAASLVLLLLVVFFFHRLRRKDLAIMRALGIPAITTARKSIYAIALSGLPMMIIGGLFAWLYISGMSGRTDAALWESNKTVQELWQSMDGSTPLRWVFIMIAGAYIALLVIAAISAWVKSRTPVIAMLTGNVK